MQRHCMEMHGGMYGYATIQPNIQPEKRPQISDARKPLWHKAFPFFPCRHAATPTKTVDLYSVGCIIIQTGLHENPPK